MIKALQKRLGICLQKLFLYLLIVVCESAHNKSRRHRKKRNCARFIVSCRNQMAPTVSTNEVFREQRQARSRCPLAAMRASATTSYVTPRRRRGMLGHANYGGGNLDEKPRATQRHRGEMEQRQRRKKSSRSGRRGRGSQAFGSS